MRIAYLHAGLHKTGTSSLQAFVRTNADVLAQLGVVVPSFHGERRYFHRNLAFELGDAGGFDPSLGGFEHLAGEVRKTDKNIFVSHEIFSTRIDQPKLLQWLVDFFKKLGCRLHVIGYVRNYPEYLNSRYSQATKRLYRHEDFAAFIENSMGHAHHELNQVFGPALDHPEVDVTIRHFDSSIVTGLEWSLIDAILPSGYDRSVFLPGERKNEAVHPKTVYLARLVTRALEAEGLPRRKPRSYVRAVKRMAEKQGWTGAKFCGLTDELVARIEAFYKERNDAFGMRVWGAPWPDAPKRSYVSNEFDPQAASAEEIAEMNALVDKVLKRGRPADARAEDDLTPNSDIEG